MPSPQERREAWVKFAAARMTVTLPFSKIIDSADAMLAEFDKRFGKEE